jgi:hypothetical protein
VAMPPHIENVQRERRFVHERFERDQALGHPEGRRRRRHQGVRTLQERLDFIGLGEIRAERAVW